MKLVHPGQFTRLGKNDSDNLTTKLLCAGAPSCTSHSWRRVCKGTPCKNYGSQSWKSAGLVLFYAWATDFKSPWIIIRFQRLNLLEIKRVQKLFTQRLTYYLRVNPKSETLAWMLVLDSVKPPSEHFPHCLVYRPGVAFLHPAFAEENGLSL